ncbi:glycoside hydrolase family 89 protein [Phanerochaete carnosa HHB-10118-sp]|uniref:Glycoside hydrolase family 89 protein n=1 Tax=Phanerochaete carnosa (strain HHB-10118-sp) TaxID=650164 RepID=K5VYE1_PHACS|nr:glycoside hydrolase family 89 protein [Phanerochaete carnosa HHB-10118-sp]EKM51629.1 glycoside hydrolase family 89 protein [Phanerochaete carnosa HHB-10118-sp]
MARLAALFALLAGLPAALAVANVTGIYGIVERRMPQHARDFVFTSMEGDGDVFVVSDTVNKTGSITVTCTTTSACARGLYTYATEFGGVDIFWTGSRLHELPSPLPKVGTPINGSAIVQYRYHFNTVTFGYTTAFWTFDKWSLLLDWLALRGVNMPLAWDGYEAILTEVFQEFGLSDAEIFEFYTAPPFQPWNRFGNVQTAWGGLLPMQWISDQQALQKQILPRMLELGMTPILPAFTGFVPSNMSAHYPNASIIDGSAWSGFPSTLTNVSFLEPFDPLYPQMQQSFITKQQEAYGNITHFYTLDQYNENNPFSGNDSYLSSVSTSTIASLRAADPEATWVMQGWLFFSSETFWTNDRIEAYLGGAQGNDSMLILDLYSEAQPQWNRTDSYFGKQWVWCELHDYGGNMGLEGNLAAITEGPIAALNSNGSSMVGMGLTMEGMEIGNEIVYDILLDQAWSSTPLNVSDWVAKWAARRYLVKTLPTELQQAWTILSTTIYNNQDPNSQATIKSILELEPATTGLVNVTGHHPTEIPYDTNTTILHALQLFVNASKSQPSLKQVPEFAVDILELSRQLMVNRFIDLYTDLINTWNSSSSTAQNVTTAGVPLLSLISDLDVLLYTNENYLFSTWIADAKQWAHGNVSYAAYLEYQARNQQTLWGPQGNINDYASKQTAGLVGEYYATRWQTFVVMLAEQKTSGQPYNATEVSQTMLSIGQAFDLKAWGAAAGETWGTKGDTFQVVDRVLERWA